MLVTCVGLHTNEGSMQKQMDFEDEQTPLQNKLNTIVEWIGKIGIISAALVFLALVLRIVFDIWAFG
jgi:magnesium-transporting ATPase (P-type)